MTGSDSADNSVDKLKLVTFLGTCSHVHGVHKWSFMLIWIMLTLHACVRLANSGPAYYSIQFIDICVLLSLWNSTLKECINT